MARRGWTRRGALGALASSGAVAACGRAPEAPAYAGAVVFAHGVASGDPGIDRVVIWTRVTPAQNGPVPVRWVVARDRQLRNVVKTGIIETSELRDYTVKVDVTGLRAGAPYFYGFLAGDQASPIGKTRTLPRGELEQLKLAVVSCASYPHGFFNVYGAIADREDIDLVVHLGDYIYEYGLGGYGGDVGVALGRIPKPEIECTSLADYRLRHAQAKEEAELKALHAACPWIVVWDDHEIADDAWSGGALNHSTPAGEGAWDQRKRAAMQAYYEWMPIRDPAPGAAFEAINRVFQFGDLFTLCMLETRLLARGQQIDLTKEMPLYETPWDFSNPAAPRPVSPAARYPDSVRMVPVPYELIGSELVPIWEWRRVQAATANPGDPGPGIYFVPDREKLRALLDRPERQLLGQAQEQWLQQQLNTAHRNGVAWQLIGNQTLMAPMLAPDLSGLPRDFVDTLERMQPGAGKLLFFSRFGVPLTTDSWDGYGAARARLIDIFRQVGGNAIVLTGDSHSAFVNEILTRDNQRVAVELAGASVTSPGYGDVFRDPRLDLNAAIQRRNPHVKWTDQRHRGYFTLTLTKDLARADFFIVSTVASREFEERAAASFTIRPDDTPGLGAPERVESERAEPPV